MVQQKLAVEFGPPVEDRRNLVVSGKVLACEQIDHSSSVAARVKLEIVVRDPDIPRYQRPVLEKTYEASRPVSSSGAEAVVRELSRCVEEIAAAIAADASAL